jgi:hypothetical protein
MFAEVDDEGRYSIGVFRKICGPRTFKMSSIRIIARLAPFFLAALAGMCIPEEGRCEDQRAVKLVVRSTSANNLDGVHPLKPMV